MAKHMSEGWRGAADASVSGSPDEVQRLIVLGRLIAAAAVAAAMLVFFFQTF